MYVYLCAQAGLITHLHLLSIQISDSELHLAHESPPYKTVDLI